MWIKTCAAIILLISLVVYGYLNTLEFLQIDVKLTEINTEDCFKINGIIGAEDLTKFEQYLITGSDDHLLQAKILLSKSGYEKIRNGELYLIDPETENVKSIKINNFPMEVAFHPHGISYKNRTLYIVNHAYSKGGERIEVFKLDNLAKGKELSFEHIELDYKYSIPLHDMHMGRVNDITVTNTEHNNDEIYITHSNPFEESKEGKDATTWAKLKYMFFVAFRIRNTYVYYCKGIDNEGFANCKAITGTGSVMNNGISYNQNKNYIYVAKTIEKKLTTYKIDENDRSVLHLIKEIDLRFMPDNIEINDQLNELTIGVFAKGIDLVNFFGLLDKNSTIAEDFSFWGGVMTMNIFTYKTKTLLLQRNKIRGTSVGIQIDKKVFLASPFDDGFLYCNLP